MSRQRRRIAAERISYGRSIGLHMIEPHPIDPHKVRVASLTWNESDDDAYYEPMLQMTGDEAQQLMDELWRCGIRPTEGQGSAGMMAATERHLKDMQSISKAALKKLGVVVE